MLTLGPVIGKLGGSEPPVEFVPDSPTSEMTVTLPDGQWAVCIGLDYETGAAATSDIAVNGEVIARLAGSSTGHRYSTGMWAITRNRDGPLVITSSVSRVKILRVFAFPDPTQQ